MEQTAEYQTREDWLKARMKGIGGSDAGAICGLNPYKSRLALYLEKIGETKPVQENEMMYWGNVLEEIVAKEFERRSGLKVREEHKILKSETHPFMIANVDRLVVGLDEGLECKTANAYVKEQWTNGKIPDSYMAQIQHYMAVTGYKAWWIAVLIGGNDFRYQRVERDDEFINMLIQLESDFWVNHVQAGVMPEADGTDSSTKIINEMFPSADIGSETILNNNVDELIQDYFEYDELAKRYSELKDETANKIKMQLGDREKGLTKKHIVNWKNCTTNRIDSKKLQTEQPEIYSKYLKPSAYRKFSIKEIKGE